MAGGYKSREHPRTRRAAWPGELKRPGPAGERGQASNFGVSLKRGDVSLDDLLHEVGGDLLVVQPWGAPSGVAATAAAEAAATRRLIVRV
jgi:hypothetical protein